MKVTNNSQALQGVRFGGEVQWIKPDESFDGDMSEAEAKLIDGNDLLSSKGAGKQGAEPGPLDGSVDDLIAHLATVRDADEVQSLLDAETAGKARKGAIAALEARRDELLA